MPRDVALDIAFSRTWVGLFAHCFDLLILVLMHFFCVCRQYGAADIVLRSCTGQVIQYFRMRSDTDKPCGGENSTHHVPHQDAPAKFGTVMAHKFLFQVNEEELMCAEIMAAAGNILEELKAMNGGKSLVQCEKLVVYSSGRYIIRDEGKISKENLGKNYFCSNFTVKYRFLHIDVRLSILTYSLFLHSALIKLLNGLQSDLRELVSRMSRIENRGVYLYETRCEIRIWHPVTSPFWPSYFFRS